MRILIIDIETSPNLAWVWGLWDQNVGINQIHTVSSVMSFAAKWHGERHVEFASVFHDGAETMVRKAWDLVDQADAVVHYNGKAFDMKHLNREFLLAGLGPPSPHTDIDLLSTVKQRFKFQSNKLDFVSKQLNIGNKVKHDGFELWLRCIQQDEQAWRLMRRYNIQDVKLTEQLYDELLPWIKQHPNRAVIDSLVEACPRCAASDFQCRGFRHTNAGRSRRFQCNKCRGYFTSNKIERAATQYRTI